jgi:large subunit ribosomal protein L24
MKTKFSTAWKSSSQPRKQRKYRHNAPLHTRQALVSAHLSAELRKQHRRRSATIRKDDVVKIMVGDFKGKKGKVTAASAKKLAAYVEGAERTRRDGTKAMIPIKAANLMIIEINSQDKKRMNKDA